uniref:Uncharacterized protein n=1 Tax=Cyanistes caeruleus TaxID=156563 RepID=A0A8C0UA36_CYACU
GSPGKSGRQLQPGGASYVSRNESREVQSCHCCMPASKKHDQEHEELPRGDTSCRPNSIQQLNPPATRGSLGIDLAASVDVTLINSTIRKIPTGVTGPVYSVTSALGAFLHPNIFRRAPRRGAKGFGYLFKNGLGHCTSRRKKYTRNSTFGSMLCRNGSSERNKNRQWACICRNTSFSVLTKVGSQTRNWNSPCVNWTGHCRESP